MVRERNTNETSLCARVESTPCVYFSMGFITFVIMFTMSKYGVIVVRCSGCSTSKIHLDIFVG